MNPLNQARKALKDAVKYALDTEVDPGTQAELWRHYQGVSAICRELKVEDSEIQFSVGEHFDGTHLYDPDANISQGLYYSPEEYGSWGAAGPVDNISIDTSGKDVITFS